LKAEDWRSASPITAVAFFDAAVFAASTCCLSRSD
jgi:hypothetical protein